ncbi:50S ribosomal protein L25 [Buchnera aphidicola]|uniref:Large ribosomal subunit protein bL25 n=1 Tax=Buchnera aphidicola str. USDA (Myzus persicae) TaxID=1009856 RepID=W0P478_BUCMP|nr:50S ribosomal protein L25 [Buchnera aphidicola]AHG60232.1 Rply [Buchnera aphidicola str. USDA (Myzus persicae)]AHG60810.1 Rply [Buchnera aphidicola str. W106 (Myzus persicae)]AHG61382.1 Rply [Buchnera aphidicola str. G002 (Myzus persicae)]AHG61955.1 Rply [Buchnera aphidicola str. F009 (Myzus persicae)]WAI03080.1 MAG: 50S ribosomal protein L25 [Buchnera aphidicola (Myzus persicae)]
MLTINAELRKETGKSFSRKLRIHNKFPGILYGVGNSNILLTLDHNSIFNLQKQISFYQECLFLVIKDEKYKVKVQAIQRHSFKLKLLHIDFLHA